MIRFKHIGCKSEIVRYVGNHPLTPDSDMLSSEWQWPSGIRVGWYADRFVICRDCLRSVLIHCRQLERIDDDPAPLICSEDWLPIEQTNLDVSALRLWSPLVIREHYDPIGDEL